MRFFLYLVKRDLKTRFAGSSLGVAWFFLQPFLNFLVYAAVFGMLFKFNVSFKGKNVEFLPFFLSGFWPWMAFQEGIMRASGILGEYAHVIKKVRFPLELLVPTAIVAPQFYFLFGSVSMVAFLIYGYGFHLGDFSNLFLLLLPFGIQLFISFGLGLMGAILNVYAKDLLAWLPTVFNLWFFATPIFYSEEIVPERYVWLLKLNPMFPVVKAYRDVFFQNTLSHDTIFALGGSACFAVFSVLMGLFLFSRGKRWLADVL